MFRTLKVPSVAAVTAGLSLDETGVLRAAVDRQRAVQAEHARAHQQLADVIVRAERFAGDVRHGRATARQLEDALIERQAAALVVSRLASELQTADAAVRTATRDALAEILAEAGKRRDKLQRVADELASTLTQLREVEAGLDEALVRAGRDLTQRLGVPPSCTLAVRALDWPAPLAG